MAANTTGNFNVALGVTTLVSNTTGSSNVAVGQSAGGGLETGGDNALVGSNAGSAFTGTESSNILVANNGVANESNTIRIGTSGTGAGQQNRAFLAGVLGSPLTGTQVLVGTGGQLGVPVSSRRFKTRIRPLGPMDRLMKLRPVSFHYKRKYAGRSDRLQYGLIAEEVAKVFPDLIVNGPDGKPYTVAYQQLPALLLAKIQDQQHAINAQSRRLKRQQAQINRLLRTARLR